MATIDFFLSFNRADRATADLVCKMVTGAGYSCFYQHADIPEGANFVQRMTSGLEQAATMLALFSPDYFQAKYALAELQAAFADDPLNERDSILPILLMEVVIPKPFTILSYVDCRPLREAEIPDMLLAALRRRRPSNHPPAVSKIPETNTSAAAQKLLDDLELADTILQSQCAVRDRLVDAIRERDPELRLATYETFISSYSNTMSPEERSLHQRIRDQTDTIQKLNRHALSCIEFSKHFQQHISHLSQLQHRLKAWLAKDDQQFLADPSIGVLYAGVHERQSLRQSPVRPCLWHGLTTAAKDGKRGSAKNPLW